MDEDDDFRPRRPWPAWVQLGLWGLPGRGWAWAFVWFSLAFAAASVAAGVLVAWPFFLGGGFVFAALWYYAAIRWVDQHGDWP